MKFSLLLILITTSAMAAQDSKGKCGNGYESKKTETGNEYCAQVELGNDAKNKQIAGSITHGVVAATCFTAYGLESSVPAAAAAPAWTSACSWADIGGNAADAGYAIAFNKNSENITGQMTTAATSLGMTAMMNKDALSGGARKGAAEGGKEAGKEGGKKAGETAGKEGTKETTKTASEETTKKAGEEGVKAYSIVPALMNVAQTASEVYGATQAGKMAKQGEQNKQEAYMAKGPSALDGGGTDTKNFGSADSGGGGSMISNPATESAATAEAVKDLLVNNPPAAAVLKKFSEMTGQPTDQLVDAVVKGGINPVMAASAQAAAAGLMSSELASNAGSLAKMAESEIAKANGDSEFTPAISYASNSKGGGSASHEDALPDLAAMMAQFMPKDENGKALDPKSASAMKFGARKPASDNDGFHPASISIFEVVDARYAMVLPKFLSGNAVEPRTPASLVPSNMYLKK